MALKSGNGQRRKYEPFIKKAASLIATFIGWKV
jgi:hypothetical protein